MNTIHKAYKFRLYPSSKQKVLLSKHFGSCRFIFNHFLCERKDRYLKEKTSLNYYDNARALTEMKKDVNFSWLKEVNSQSLQASIRNLDISYRRFFEKKSKFPKFKSKYNKQTFTIPQNVMIGSGKLAIPKFKKGIKAIFHQKLKGKILFATVSKTLTDKYFVSIICEVKYKPFKKSKLKVGIDTGIKYLAILSNGKKYKNIKPLKTGIKHLKHVQRLLSKKIKGSNSRNKQRRKVASYYEKVTNIRKDYLHKVSTEIVKNHDFISVEDLNVKKMMKNSYLAQALSDVSLGEFYRQLEYKSEWNNRKFVKIDRFFPSSKTCSTCGWINQNLNLSIRKWECPVCRCNHNRDVNAALNILNQGLNVLSGSGTESDTKQKQVEATTLVVSKKPETSVPCA